MIILIGPWFLFKFITGIGIGQSAGGGIVWFSGDPELGEAAVKTIHYEIFWRSFKELFFDKACFNLLIPFWVVLTAIGIKEALRSELKYLYIILALVIGGYYFVYLSLQVEAISESAGLHRNFLTFMPIVCFVSAMLLVKLWPKAALKDKSSD